MTICDVIIECSRIGVWEHPTMLVSSHTTSNRCFGDHSDRVSAEELCAVCVRLWAEEDGSQIGMRSRAHSSDSANQAALGISSQVGYVRYERTFIEKGVRK
jgi:hypothetical protein